MSACALLACTVVMGAACGSDRSGGPRGTPHDVVGNAPQLTVGAGTARVFIDGTDAAAQGVVDFANQRSELNVSDGSTVILTADGVYRRAKGASGFSPSSVDALPPALRPADPVKAVDLVRGAGAVRSDGGGEVRGASALQYTVDIVPGPYQIEVAVDSQGRLRRGGGPVAPRAGPPGGRPAGGDPAAPPRSSPPPA